jgi:hypothetical protein
MDPGYFDFLVKCYGSSMYDTALDDLSSLCSQYEKTGAVLQDVVPSDAMQVCVARLVNAIQFNQSNTCEWRCLCFLTNTKCYSGAYEMLTVFADRRAGRSMLAHCHTVISEGDDDDELTYCFRFLHRFTHNSGDRRGMVYNNAELRRALFSYLAEERFVTASCATQTEALEAVYNVVRQFLCGCREHRGDVFLRDGVLDAVKCAALYVFSLGAEEDEAEWDRLDRAKRCLWVTLRVATSVPSERRVNLNENEYKLSRNDVFRVSVAIYQLLQIYRERPQEQASKLVVGYAAYLREMYGPEVLKAFLLYKPPRDTDTDTKRVALFIAEWAIESGEACEEDTIMGPLQQFAEAIPEVAVILNSLPPRPEWIEKGRRCAAPFCNLDGEGLYNKMKMCARCKAVYYCCVLHQQQHWSEHRLTCVKIAAPLAVAADIEAVQDPRCELR